VRCARQDCVERTSAKTAHPFVSHDRDSIFSATSTWRSRRWRTHILNTTVRTPQTNLKPCPKKLIGIVRQACLDWLIPIHEDISDRFFATACSTCRATVLLLPSRH
jgi:hypothetical protein